MYIIDDYLDYMRASKGSSENTIKEYYYDVRSFLRFIKNRKENLNLTPEEMEELPIDTMTLEDLQSIQKQDIYSYVSYLDRVRKNNNRTKYRKLSSVRSFFNYLCNKMDLLQLNPTENIDLPKIEKNLPTYLTLEESIHFLNSVKNKEGNSLYKARDYAIITLFLNTGMRLSELSSIDVKDLNSDGSLRIIGKGNKERMIYLNTSCKESIVEYLKIRSESNLPKDGPLFLSMRKNRMNNRSIQHMVKKHLQEAGFDTEKYTVHKLRHTAATLMYQYGDSDLRSLQEILGHESVTTTQIYTHVGQSEIKHAMYSNPLSNPENLKED
ncbi:tyrosine recombinase XerC [Peptoniphilus sp. KCTC 25270]|uniref:tyrosine recombinase XerC n=1 Tax=Peptoniphilus sp. KCTC 25270 TaxID=2897414 RepID=UPI001E3901FC|nr:tyrosine recombinase XerC [Peptoniphilus sp. KCTC 25270]MCD1147007.1 tyrosine recombinase XerC [Peptoniphilus sp. KCTC 25270]